jgi:hypothetical protein
LRGPDGSCRNGTADAAVVVTVNVVVAGDPFGVTDVGLKVAALLAGNPATLKVTALAKPPALGVTVIVNVNVCPAFAVALVPLLTVKSLPAPFSAIV